MGIGLGQLKSIHCSAEQLGSRHLPAPRAACSHSSWCRTSLEFEEWPGPSLLMQWLEGHTGLTKSKLLVPASLAWTPMDQDVMLLEHAVDYCHVLAPVVVTVAITIVDLVVSLVVGLLMAGIGKAVGNVVSTVLTSIAAQ
jgi:hypothetical protein